MKILGSYINGNTQVTIHDDGTKIRETQDNDFVPEFPESFDCKITNYCDADCPYCHEDSNERGQHGDLTINLFKTLKPFTEIAIGGGNPLSHPDLITFLTLLKSQNVVASMTVNQRHLFQFRNTLTLLIENKLIHGLGISITHYNKEDFELAKSFGDNVVFHIINGIVTKDILEKIGKSKILILGYKSFRRGKSYYSNAMRKIDEQMTELKTNIKQIIKNAKICSFDNLALEQLKLKDIMSEKIWNEFYQGDDGTHTMYYDAITQTAGISSIVSLDDRLKISKTDTLIDIFNKIKLKVI